MNRRLLFLPMAAAVALAACNSKTPSEAQQPAPAATAATAPTAVKPPIAPGKQLEQPMPDGVALAVPYNAVYDKTLPAKDGTQRRRVIVEFLDGTTDSVARDLDSQLRKAGYRKGAPREEKGGTRVNYARRADGSRVSILIRPHLDQRFRDKRALGTASFSWTPPQPASSK
jgi:glucose/arabinose dehydrogenase